MRDSDLPEVCLSLPGVDTVKAMLETEELELAEVQGSTVENQTDAPYLYCVFVPARGDREGDRVRFIWDETELDFDPCAERRSPLEKQLADGDVLVMMIEGGGALVDARYCGDDESVPAGFTHLVLENRRLTDRGAAVAAEQLIDWYAAFAASRGDTQQLRGRLAASSGCADRPRPRGGAGLTRRVRQRPRLRG